MPELILLFTLVVAVWFWFDHRHVQERANTYCRRACADADVQFLDETAAVTRVRLARDEDGVMRIERRLNFEYSGADGYRGAGYVTMRGDVPVAFQLCP